jgi:hypothetical protein
MKKNKKLKRFSLVNLITGYAMLCLFVLLVLLNRSVGEQFTEVAVVTEEEILDDELFNGVHFLKKEDKGVLNKETLHVNNHPVEVYTDRIVYRDRGAGVILDSDNDDVVVVRDIDDRRILVNKHDNFNGGTYNDQIHIARRGVGSVEDIRDGDYLRREHHGNNAIAERNFRDRPLKRVDAGLLDRRLTELDGVGVVDVSALDRAVRESGEDEFGIDGDELSGLTLSRDGDDADFELDLDFKPEGAGKKGYGLDKGDLYAYNFPSQGVGAGIGSGAVGAGAGGGAGIGGGIGEAVLQGQTVPTLGGIGTSSAMPLEGQAEGSPPTDGVGGLVSGAGTGGAAGLVTGTVAEKLGLGIGVGDGAGAGESGIGHGGECNYEHLPKDGALYIMMHVDGSGSILNTRKQLDIMKDTLLKDALLPYYNNDESLYNRRVQIVDGNGERTLQFFTEAAKKGNVLAVAFQDEAQPVYHLPTFNKKPQDNYSKDLAKLKKSLNGYGGVYRGIMFQVDRGRTFAKSFKEFVECSWRGEGYLEKDNLKKYYWEHNRHHIKNKDGVVFSDVYHTKDSGDSQYYLDLIFQASKNVGLDLDIYGAGLTDGEHVSKD